MSESIYFDTETSSLGKIEDLIILDQSKFTPEQWTKLRQDLYFADNDREVGEIILAAARIQDSKNDTKENQS